MAVSDRTKLVLGLMVGAAVIAVLALLPASPPDIRSPRAAEFRHNARTVYINALRESCAPVTQWPRDKFLRRHRQALAEFENSHAGPLGAQLQIARADAVLDLGCWDDGKSEYAKIHVQLARTEVLAGLARLEQLAPEIGDGFLTAPAAPRPAALFRKAVRGAVLESDPPCTISAKADNDTVLAAAQQELAKFRRGLTGERATDFDIAEADQLYDTSIAVPECAAPSDLPVAELGAQVAAQMGRHIAGLRKLL